jgi:hypothetical protein
VVESSLAGSHVQVTLSRPIIRIVLIIVDAVMSGLLLLMVIAVVKSVPSLEVSVVFVRSPHHIPSIAVWLGLLLVHVKQRVVLLLNVRVGVSVRIGAVSSSSSIRVDIVTGLVVVTIIIVTTREVACGG